MPPKEFSNSIADESKYIDYIQNGIKKTFEDLAKLEASKGNKKTELKIKNNKLSLLNILFEAIYCEIKNEQSRFWLLEMIVPFCYLTVVYYFFMIILVG